MTFSPRLRRLVSTGSKFLLVGAVSTVIEIAVFNLCLLVFEWDPVTSKVVASIVALVNAYFGNREWAFRHRTRRDRTSEIVWFLAVNGACLALGAALVWAGVWLGELALGRAVGPLGVNLVNIASIVIVVFVRFALYHFIVFRAPRPTGE